MILDRIIKAVADEMPKFNEFLLKTFPERQVDDSIKYTAKAYEQATAFVNNVIQFEGYHILSPEERASYELNVLKRVSVARSELVLVAYNFLHEGIRHTVHVYMPYMVDHLIVLRDTPYAIILGITEKIFSVSSNEVSVRVIRQPLKFQRTKVHKLVSALDGAFTNEFIVSAKLYNKNVNRKDGATITALDYILAKFGFRGTLARFGLDDQCMHFDDKISDDKDRYEYFEAKQRDGISRMIYLKVLRTILTDPNIRKFAANVIFTLSFRNRQTLEELYDPNGSMFRLFIGELITGGASEGLAQNNADAHMASVDKYLDPTTKTRLNGFGLMVQDIYDLLQHMFIEIDQIVTNSVQQDLYDKRIEVMENVLINTIVKSIFRRIYSDGKNIDRLKGNDVRRLVAISPMSIRSIGKAITVAAAPQVYNGCWLLAYGLNKIRLTGPAGSTGTVSPNASESRFHTSVASVESMMSLSGNNPGITGLINPFIEIDDGGGIIRPDYADDIDWLRDHLPYKQ